MEVVDSFAGLELNGSSSYTNLVISILSIQFYVLEEASKSTDISALQQQSLCFYGVECSMRELSNQLDHQSPSFVQMFCVKSTKL